MPSPAPARRRTRVLMSLTALVLALVVGVLTVVAGTADGSRRDNSDTGKPVDITVPDEQEGRGPDLARRDPGDPHAVGRADAPVVLVEYADFRCPFCGKFARDTKPELVEEYVDQGVLRIEWRYFPLFGEASESAARAAYAAGRQKRFWQFHDAVYAESRQKDKSAFSEDELIAMAREAGVRDLKRFRADMDGDTADRAVKRDSEEAYQLGATSTPAFLINGTPVLGAQPAGIFRDAIEKAQARAKAGAGGKDGKDGKDGRDREDGQDGQDGRGTGTSASEDGG